MRHILILLFLFFLVPPVSAEEIPLFVQNTTPQVEIAENFAHSFKDLVQEKGELTLIDDKFDKSIQILIQGTNAYTDLYVVSVTYVVQNGSCPWYYKTSLFPTTEKQIAYEAATLYANLLRQLPQLEPLLE